METQKILITFISHIQSKLNDKRILLFVISLFIGLLFYHNYLTPNYSIDDYNELYNYQVSRGSMYGRVVVAVYIWFFEQLGINLVASQPLFTIIALIIFSLAQLLISNKLIANLKVNRFTTKILIHILISTNIFNLFSVDLFQFNTYLLGFSISVFFVALAIYRFNIKSKYNLIIQFLLLSLSVFTYQAWLPYYFIIIPILITSYSISLKNKIIYGLKTFLIYTFASVLNFSWVKYFHPAIFSVELSERLQSNNFFENLNAVISFQERLWVDSLSLAPKGLFLLFLFLMIAYILIKVKADNRKKLLIIYIFVYLSISSLVFLPHLFTNEFWPAPRSIVSIMALPTIVPIYFLLIEKQKVFPRFLIFLILFIFCINFILINRISYDHLVVNRRDKEVVTQIYNEIHAYEETNGEVKKIIYGVYEPAYCDSDVICSFEINVRAIYVDWAFPYMLKAISGREFIYEKIEAPTRKIMMFNNDEFLIVI